MYNLLVSGNAKNWQGEPWDIELNRVVREYTVAPLTARYGDLNDDAVKELMTFPCIFAFEHGNQKPARIGWLTRVRHRQNTVRVEYEFDAALPEIDPDLIIKNQWDLDIGEWEMNRTHWAVKDVDLFPVLMEAGVLDPKLIHSQPKRSKIITLGLDRPTAGIEARPTVFKLPDAKRRSIWYPS